MGEPFDIKGPGHPEPGSFDRLQHVLQPVGPLAPCWDCGSVRRPLVMKPLRTGRRTVRCIGCGRFFTVDAKLTDDEIAGIWNQRAVKR